MHTVFDLKPHSSLKLLFTFMDIYAFKIQGCEKKKNPTCVSLYAKLCKVQKSKESEVGQMNDEEILNEI